MTEAKHFSSGKVQLHQLPRWVLWQVAKVCMYGTMKYGKWNWRAGMPWSELFDSATRHQDDWWEGVDTDHESGLHHLDHAICDLIFLRWYTRQYQKGDDRPLIRGPNFTNLYEMDGTISPELQEHWEQLREKHGHTKSEPESEIQSSNKTQGQEVQGGIRP
jgi:hypothetical protein